VRKDALDNWFTTVLADPLAPYVCLYCCITGSSVSMDRADNRDVCSIITFSCDNCLNEWDVCWQFSRGTPFDRSYQPCKVIGIRERGGYD
jgi:hypothetical protein